MVREIELILEDNILNEKLYFNMREFKIYMFEISNLSHNKAVKFFIN